MNKIYNVQYMMNSWDTAKNIIVLARNKEEAYDIAMYDMIPEKELYTPYAAWVSSVTYQNGNYKKFNTSAGNPY